MPRLRSLLAGFALTTGLISITAPAASAVIPTPSAPACVTSVVPNIPLAPFPNYSPVLKPFAELTATDNHGLWAGFRYDGQTGFQVIGWRAGRFTVLDSFNYPFAYFDEKESLKVVGITAAGAIIVDAEDPTYDQLNRRVLYRYQNGQRFAFGHNGNWTSWQATAVSPDGHVSGLAMAGKTSYVVEWNPNGAPTIVATGGSPLIDGYDDLIWQPHPTTSPQFDYRTPAGHIGRLQLAGGSAPSIITSAGRWVFSEGSNAGRDSFVRWDMAKAAGTTTLLPSYARTQTFMEPVAVSANATYVAERYTYQKLDPFGYYDAYGDSHPMPASFLGEYGNEQPIFGVSADGTVSFAGPDGHVQFMNCPLNYAKHNPRGVIYHGAVVGGQTLITGGSFDSDDVAGHDLVYVFDQTTSTRRLLATVTADQYDPSFSQAYGISGNHRYRYAFPAVPGKHTYCAYGRNIGYGNQNTLLGCTTVTA